MIDDYIYCQILNYICIHPIKYPIDILSTGSAVAADSLELYESSIPFFETLDSYRSNHQITVKLRNSRNPKTSYLQIFDIE